jgi:NAD(P)-dependent dehydrogenase (short-subunit alcohol dehydrogenase family)
MTKRVFVTGSTTGIGLTTAQMIVEGGHEVVLHARNDDRASDVRSLLDAPVVVGDLASLDSTEAMAEEASALGPFDAVIHNAGIYESRSRIETVDGLEQTFQVNVAAPYLLTALVPIPARLVYLTSGLASGGEIVLDDLQRQHRPWSRGAAYRDSKLADIALALGIASRYPETTVTAVCPGWVQTRMGGAGAPTDVHTGSATQVWLATSDQPAALRTGRFIRHMNELAIPPAAANPSTQGGLLEACRLITGVALP